MITDADQKFGPGENHPQNVSQNIVSLDAFRRKKAADQDLTRGRRPLYVSHLEGRVSDSPLQKNAREEGDFAGRIERIKTSLNKINRLMAELKRMSASVPPEH